MCGHPERLFGRGRHVTLGWRVVVVRRVVAVWCGCRWSASPREIWWAFLVEELLVWAWSKLWVIESLVVVGCCFAE